MERNILFWLALIWSLFIGVACLADASSIPKTSVFTLPYKDKIAHFVFYFIFSGLWFSYYAKRKKEINRLKIALIVFVVASLTGALVELMQYKFTVSRSAEWADVLANTSGSFTGLLLCLILFKIKK